jgi:hypothetical protein
MWDLAFSICSINRAGSKREVDVPLAFLLFLDRRAAFLAGTMALPVFQNLMPGASRLSAVRADHHHV